MRRARIPPIAWVLSGGLAVALFVLAGLEIAQHGHAQFFHDGDSYFYLRTALSPFGNGAGYSRTAALEIPYRYGRIGFPLVSWLLAFGRPPLVSWSMIFVYLVSLAAIPGIAATLLADYGAPPVRAAFVLLTPGILLMTGLAYAEAPQIALLLLACVFEARRHRRSALATLAFAILVKETSVLALLPWVLRACKRRDPRQLAACIAVVVPYALWTVWVRLRIGQFPFLAHAPARREALSAPGVGIRHALRNQSPNHTFVVTVTVLTFVLGVVAAWVGRRYWIGPITAAFTALIPFYGPGALYYVLENLRLLSVPTVFAILCLVVAWSPPESAADSQPEPSSGARNLPV